MRLDTTRPPKMGLAAAAEEDEVGALMRACAAAADGTPPGHPARNELRLLRDKLASLHDVRDLTSAAERDAMLGALLDSDHCGVGRIEELLGARAGPWPRGKADPDWPSPIAAEHPPVLAGMACDDARAASTARDGAPSARAPHGRRLLMLADELASDGVLHDLEDHPPPPPPLVSLLSRLLDRPLPWARDCDCCFETCPPGAACIRTQGLYVACRGDSIGALMSAQLRARPGACAVGGASALLLLLAWLRAQIAHCGTRRAQRPSPHATGCDKIE